MLADYKWTQASDVFSFGVVMFEVFSHGQLPHGLLSDEALILRLIDKQVSFPSLLFGPALKLMTSSL